MISRFADDTKIIRGIGDLDGVASLQSDIDKVTAWAQQNMMVFNENKFVHMNVNPTTFNHPFVTYNSSSNIIPTKFNHIDLGITMNGKLDFKQHICNLCAKAKSKSLWILRTFRTRESYPLMVLFKTMILPILEYCIQVWSPVEKGLKLQIESVQRFFTSKIAGLEANNYWQRLEILRIYSIQRRHERYLIIYTWKIIEGIVPDPAPSYFEVIVNPRKGRKIKRLTHVSGTNRKITSLRHGSFFVVGPRLFNCLPKEVRDVTNVGVETFKKHLDRFIGAVPDEPPVYGAVWTNSLLDWRGVVARRVAL